MKRMAIVFGLVVALLAPCLLATSASALDRGAGAASPKEIGDVHRFQPNRVQPNYVQPDAVPGRAGPPRYMMARDTLELEDRSGYSGEYIFGMTKGIMRSTLTPALKPVVLLLTVPLDLVFLPFAAIAGFF